MYTCIYTFPFLFVFLYLHVSLYCFLHLLSLFTNLLIKKQRKTEENNVQRLKEKSLNEWGISGKWKRRVKLRKFISSIPLFVYFVYTYF